VVFYKSFLVSIKRKTRVYPTFDRMFSTSIDCTLSVSHFTARCGVINYTYAVYALLNVKQT